MDAQGEALGLDLFRARIGKYSNAFSITMQPIMLLPQINPRYDLPKLTKEEWDEYKRIRPKALVGPDDR